MPIVGKNMLYKIEMVITTKYLMSANNLFESKIFIPFCHGMFG